MRGPAIGFAVIYAVPHLAARETHQRPREFSVVGENGFFQHNRRKTDLRECPSNVRFRGRLCENSNAELARRIFISISSLWKPIALVGADSSRQLRKPF